MKDHRGLMVEAVECRKRQVKGACDFLFWSRHSGRGMAVWIVFQGLYSPII